MKKILFLTILTFTVVSCNKDQSENCAFIPNTDNISVNFQFQSFEDSLPAIKTKQQLVKFFSEHTEIRDNFFNRSAYPDDSVFINGLFNRFSHPSFDTLLIETKKVFGNGDELKNQFTEAFKNIKYYYPEFNPPKIQTLITGLETDVMVTDSLVIIGLDYFLGPDGKFKPNMYDYILRRYNKSFIVPSVVLLMGISEKFNKTNMQDKTVLADMLAYGKAYSFTKRMMPCSPDSVLIGFTQRELDGAIYNESTIWKRMIEDQILFSTSHMIKQRYIGERPKTIEISAQCPGRIGMWVGWRMADKFMEANNKSLNDLMQEPDAQKIFKMSKYKPN